MPPRRHNQARLADAGRALDQEQRAHHLPSRRAAAARSRPEQRPAPEALAHDPPRPPAPIVPPPNTSVHPRKSTWSATARNRSARSDPGPERQHAEPNQGGTDDGSRPIANEDPARHAAAADR